MALSNKLEELVDRISRQREKLFASISGLSDTQLNHKQSEDTWSISDVLNHVSLVDEANAKLTSNMLKRARAENPPPDPSPEGSELHSLDEIFKAMSVSKFHAPEFIAPHTHSSVEDSLARLKTSRERMLANVEQLNGFDLTGVTYAHPFAGPLNTYQWILIAGAHEHRHAEQIERIKAQPGFPS
jgi:uncharacterized damage-inducible protein DinB